MVMNDHYLYAKAHYDDNKQGQSPPKLEILAIILQSQCSRISIHTHSSYTLDRT